MRLAPCLVPITFFVLACDSDSGISDPPVPVRAAVPTSISAVDGFHFLPPVGEPSSAANDPTVHDRLAVDACVPAAATCAVAASYSHDAIRIEDGYYALNVHTKPLALAPGTAYRVRVTGDGFELGAADFVADRGGRTIALKFIVEAGAIPSFIAFVSSRTGDYEIYTVKPDGSSETRLTTTAGDDYWPAWSPDRSKIVFASNRLTGPATNGFDIYTMNANGSNVTRITTSSSYDGWPRFSPDGSKIAFTSDRAGNFDVWVMNADGSNPVRLTVGSDYDVNPEWSPDGSRILFRRLVSGNWDLYVMNADGSNMTRLTTQPGIDYDGGWSPDGTRIVYFSDASGQDGVWVMNADGSGKTKLPQVGSRDLEPAWSPDGSQIVFSVTEAGGNHLYIMNADGSSPHRITNSSYDVQPRWH
ncbi:MAG: hypothetical protein ACT4O1_16595 [Gemmatimonadota bacterium]